MSRALRVWPVWLLLSGALGAQEAPPVFKVTLEFEGNETFSSFELERALSALRADLSREGVDEAGVEDAGYELQRYYQSRGFPRVQIQHRWEREGDAYKIHFAIEAGPRSFLASLSFDGNDALDAGELVPCFAWIRAGIFGIEPLGLGKEVFTEDVLKAGIYCVERRYQHLGYYFVEAAFETSAGEEGVEVKVIVEEGPRIEVAEPPGLEGNEAYSAEKLREVLDLDAGAIYTPRLPVMLKGKLVDFYKERGYFFVEIDVDRSVDRSATAAKLHFVIREGPLTTIDDIQLSGNETTWDWVIRQRIRLQPGDLYNEEQVRETYRSILLSGLFTSVKIETTPVEGQEDRVVTKIEVAEKKRFRASVLGGYGTYELLRGKVVLEDINFAGLGHRVRLEGRASFRGERGELEYLNPYFFTESLSQNAALEYERREHPSFDSTEVGGRFGFSYRLSRKVRTNLLYRLRESDADNIKAGVAPALVEDVLLSSLEWSTVLEYRNRVLQPDSGSTHRFSVEYASPAFGSELHYVQYVLSTTWIFPVWLDLRVVANARFGVIHPLGFTDDIPIQERFFLGGENSIRSFKQDEAGPQSNGHPIGGEAFTLYNLELRYPIFRDLHGAVFADTGTLTERFEDFGGGRYFSAVGTGVRYLTPIGPLRLDFAINPDRRKGEDEYQIYFSLGYPF